MSLEAWFIRSWYGERGWTNIFKPIQPLVKHLVDKKRMAFLTHPENSYQAPVPVIVVGNISVGGTGKSPMVVALCELLKEQGYRPGIVSRGHGAKITSPTHVYIDSLASEVGDEPVMLARRAACPMVVFPNRAKAVQHLLATTDVNVVLSDDGMQHYRLNRDIEIAMLDAERGIGNGQLLPVGPLREPVERLSEVDFVVSIAAKMTKPLSQLTLSVELAHLIAEHLVSLDGSKMKHCDQAFSNDDPWHVIAAIGNPQRFLNTLKGLGLKHIASQHWFADHHAFSVSDIPDSGPVVMTEKDSVKCQFLDIMNSNLWYLPVSLVLPEPFKQAFVAKLKQIEVEDKHHE
ncbi:tetraacyldisaccharide 4'-kinase [Marinomonas transparens]|uniref:Tetraacyldisaccharide 4'-kinase n=1 Tax=Marinomonas transparens TaxID=2795388 RepID=A0A934N1W3_9GAMM|nr:tetraacyldisaccharide 4'-kinase [Marinomonas transparens]MBJ7538147.1 tetraacyldisaccharide 4'-kinase [Marinomonas transparens]